MGFVVVNVALVHDFVSLLHFSAVGIMSLAALVVWS